MERKKTEERIRLEQRTRLQGLSNELNSDLALQSLVEQEKAQDPSRSLKRTIAWLVLLGAIGLAVFPAIGNGWTLFYFGLSLYMWRFFVGLAVVLVAVAGISALVYLLKTR